MQLYLNLKPKYWNKGYMVTSATTDVVHVHYNILNSMYCMCVCIPLSYAHSIRRYCSYTAILLLYGYSVPMRLYCSYTAIRLYSSYTAIQTLYDYTVPIRLYCSYMAVYCSYTNAHTSVSSYTNVRPIPIQQYSSYTIIFVLYNYTRSTYTTILVPYDYTRLILDCI